MIDLNTEQLLRAADVPDLTWLPKRRNGTKLARETVLKWVRDGLRGIHLEHVLVGGVVCTSEPALKRFFVRLSAPPAEQHQPTPEESRDSQSQAEAILAAAGI